MRSASETGQSSSEPDLVVAESATNLHLQSGRPGIHLFVADAFPVDGPASSRLKQVLIPVSNEIPQSSSMSPVPPANRLRGSEEFLPWVLGLGNGSRAIGATVVDAREESTEDVDPSLPDVLATRRPVGCEGAHDAPNHGASEDEKRFLHHDPRDGGAAFCLGGVTSSDRLPLGARTSSRTSGGQVSRLLAVAVRGLSAARLNCPLVLVELFAEEDQRRGAVTGCGFAVRDDGSEAVCAGGVAPRLVAEGLR